jgi:hypothetical protein
MNNIFGSGVLVSGGVPSNPGVRFIDDEQTGMYHVNGEFGISYDGVPMIRVTGDGVNIRNLVIPQNDQVFANIQAQLNVLSANSASLTQEVKNNQLLISDMERYLLGTENSINAVKKQNADQGLQITNLLADSNRNAIVLDDLAKKTEANKTSLDLIARKLNAPFSAKISWDQFDDQGHVNLNVNVDDVVAVAFESNAYVSNPIFVSTTNPLTLKTQLPKVMTFPSVTGINRLRNARLRTGNIGIAFLVGKNLYYQRSYDPEGLTWKEPQLLVKNVTSLSANIVVGSMPRVLYVKNEKAEFIQATESNANAWAAPVTITAAKRPFLFQNILVYEDNNMIYSQDVNNGTPSLVADFHNHQLVLAKLAGGWPHIVAKSNDDNKFYSVRATKVDGSEWPSDPVAVPDIFARVTDIAMGQNLVYMGISSEGNAIVDNTRLDPATTVTVYRQGSRLLPVVTTTDQVIKMYDYENLAALPTVLDVAVPFAFIQNHTDTHPLVLYPAQQAGRVAIRRVYDKLIVHVK